MTRVCDPPLPVTVDLGPDGVPARLHAPTLAGALSPVARWVADADWWTRPLAREYWKVLLGDLLLEVFHDLHQDAWYLERIYD